MKLISWNVRVVNSTSKRSVIKGVVALAKGEFFII